MARVSTAGRRRSSTRSWGRQRARPRSLPSPIPADRARPRPRTPRRRRLLARNAWPSTAGPRRWRGRRRRAGPASGSRRGRRPGLLRRRRVRGIEGKSSSLNHQLRAPSQGYLESAVEQVLRRQWNERRGRLDGNGAVPVSARHRRIGAGLRFGIRDRNRDVWHAYGGLADDVGDVRADDDVAGTARGVTRICRVRGGDPVRTMHDRVARAFARGVRERVLLPYRASDVEEPGDDEKHQRQEQRELDERLAPVVVAVSEEAWQPAQ